MRRTALLLVAVSLLVSACGRDRATQRVPLDGSPRIPDAEGIVEAVSRQELTLVGGRTFTIGDELQSFSSQTMEAVPVRQRAGQFVHIGFDGDRLVWIAAIGSVVPGDDPVVYYTGTVAEVADGRVIFDDGTVLRLEEGLDPEVTRGAAVAEIDPDRGKVRALRAP